MHHMCVRNFILEIFCFTGIIVFILTVFITGTELKKKLFVTETVFKMSVYNTCPKTYTFRRVL
jgi:hypothetical protein